MGLAAITFTACSVSVKGKAEDFDVIKFSNEIVALSHRGGETISVVHSGMESVLNIVNPTQQEVAKQTGISQQTLSRWENDMNIPNMLFFYS